MMVEKGIRSRIYHALHRHAKASNKYVKNCNKNIESSYLMYLDAKKFVWIGNVSKITSKWF